MVLWMVFQMPVRYTDVGSDTGGASGREKKKLFHSGHHRKTVVGGSCIRESIPAEGQDDFHWKEPVWEKGDTACGTRPGAGSEREAQVRRSPSFEIQHHGTVFPCAVSGMPP